VLRDLPHGMMMDLGVRAPNGCTRQPSYLRADKVFADESKKLCSYPKGIGYLICEWLLITSPCFLIVSHGYSTGVCCKAKHSHKVTGEDSKHLSTHRT